jgi:hypothetical protein
MTNRARRYWAIRTDRNNRELLFHELGEGRLGKAAATTPAKTFI